MTDLRILGPWFLAVFLNSYAVTLYCAGCFDLAGEKLGAQANVQLWLSAGWGLAYIFISLIAGKISEKWGPRTTIIRMAALSILACALGSLLMQTLTSSPAGPWLLLALMLPVNITTTACWPALESAISRSIGQMRLSTRIAVYNLSWAAAGFTALFTRGALEKLSWHSVFIVPALIMGISCAVLLLFGISRVAQIDPHAAEASHDSEAVKRRAKTLLHMAWLGNALAYVGINVITPVLMKMADASGVSDLAVAGIVTSIWGFSRAAGFVLVGKWIAWHYKARWLVGAQLALAASFLLMMIVPSLPVLIAAQIVFGLAAALIYSSSLYYAMHTSEGSGGHAGFHEALIGMGIFLGPAIGAIAGGGTNQAGKTTDPLTRIGLSVTAVLLLGAIIMWVMGAGKDRKLVTEETR